MTKSPPGMQTSPGPGAPAQGTRSSDATGCGRPDVPQAAQRRTTPAWARICPAYAAPAGDDWQVPAASGSVEHVLAHDAVELGLLIARPVGALAGGDQRRE